MLGIWIRNAVKCFKYCLIGHTTGGMEDRGAKFDLMNWGARLPQDVSEKNFSMLPRDGSCNNLVKNVAAFCLCPKSLPEAKVKRFELMPLAEEISKPPRIDSAMWLVISGNANEDL